MTEQRLPLAYEGRMSMDRRLIQARALHFDRGFTPVTAYPRPGDLQVVGLAALFQRDADGLITAEVRMLDGLDVPDNVNAHIEISDAEFEHQGDVLVVTSGLIRRVHLSSGPWGWERDV